MLHDARGFDLGEGVNIIRITDLQARRLSHFIPAGSVGYAINSSESTATFLQTGGCAMSAGRVGLYADVVNTGKFGKALRTMSELERARIIVGTYIVSVPANIMSGPDYVRSHLENSRYVSVLCRLHLARSRARSRYRARSLSLSVSLPLSLSLSLCLSPLSLSLSLSLPLSSGGRLVGRSVGSYTPTTTARHDDRSLAFSPPSLSLSRPLSLPLSLYLFPYLSPSVSLLRTTGTCTCYGASPCMKCCYAELWLSTDVPVSSSGRRVACASTSCMHSSNMALSTSTTS